MKHIFKSILFLFCLYQAIDARGQVLFEKLYEVPQFSALLQVIPSSDGGAYSIMNGSTFDLPDDQDTTVSVLTKYDSEFEIEWSKRIRISSGVFLVNILELTDGSVLAVGKSDTVQQAPSPIPLMVRLSNTGEPIWQRFLSMLGSGYLSSPIYLSSDVFMSISGLFSADQFHLVRFDSDGSDMSAQEVVIDGALASIVKLHRISDQNFLIMGNYFRAEVNRYVTYVAKISDDEVQWAKSFDFGFDADFGSDFVSEDFFLTTLSDGDIAFCASYELNLSIAPSEEALVRLSPEGELKWAKQTGNSDPYDLEGFNGLLAGENGTLDISFSNVSLREVYFAGFDEEGETLYTTGVDKSQLSSGYGLEYRRTDGIKVLSGRYGIDPENLQYASVIALQGDNGTVSCEQSGWMQTITNLTPAVNDIMLQFNDVPIEFSSPDISIFDMDILTETYCSLNLSTSGLQPEQELIVYPNPSSDYVTIQSDAFNLSGSNYSISDVSGRLLASGMVEADQKIDLSKFEKGLCVLQIKHDKGEESFRVVIE